MYHSSMPYYDQQAKVEVYRGEKSYYTVDVAINQIVEIDPINIQDNSDQSTTLKGGESYIQQFADRLI